MNYFKFDENNNFVHTYNYDKTNYNDDYLVFSEDEIKELSYNINEYLLANRNNMEMYYGINYSKDFEEIGIFNTKEDFNDMYIDEDLSIDYVFCGDKNDVIKLLNNLNDRNKTIITKEEINDLDNYMCSFEQKEFIKFL